MFITNLKCPTTYYDESKHPNFTNKPTFRTGLDESDKFDKFTKHENLKKSMEVLKEIKVSRNFILLL